MSTHLVKVSFYQPWTMAQGHRHCHSRGQVTAPRGNSTPWLRRRGPAKEALPKWSVLTASSSAQGRRASSLEEQPCAVLVSISRGHLRGFWPACTRQGERQVQESCSPPSTSPGPGLVFSKHRFGVLSLPSQNFLQFFIPLSLPFSPAHFLLSLSLSLMQDTVLCWRDQRKSLCCRSNKGSGR